MHSVCLSVCLRMKGGQKIGFNSNEFVKVFHELCGELGSSVANDFLRQSVFAPNMIAVDLGGLERREGVADGDE